MVRSAHDRHHRRACPSLAPARFRPRAPPPTPPSLMPAASSVGTGGASSIGRTPSRSTTCGCPSGDSGPSSPCSARCWWFRGAWPTATFVVPATSSPTFATRTWHSRRSRRSPRTRRRRGTDLKKLERRPAARGVPGGRAAAWPPRARHAAGPPPLGPVPCLQRGRGHTRHGGAARPSLAGRGDRAAPRLVAHPVARRGRRTARARLGLRRPHHRANCSTSSGAASSRCGTSWR